MQASARRRDLPISPVDSLSLGRDNISRSAVKIVGLDDSEHILLPMLSAESPGELEEEGRLSKIDSAKHGDAAKLLDINWRFRKPDAPLEFVAVVERFYRPTVRLHDTGRNIVGFVIARLFKLYIFELFILW